MREQLLPSLVEKHLLMEETPTEAELCAQEKEPRIVLNGDSVVEPTNENDHQSFW